MVEEWEVDIVNHNTISDQDLVEELGDLAPDPGHTCGRHFQYQQSHFTYWIMKTIFVKALMMRTMGISGPIK